MSALDTSKIQVGAITKIEFAPYVTAKGAGTYVDAGATIGGYSLEDTTEFYDTYVDQRLGVVEMDPQKRTYKASVELAQNEIENLRMALGLPAGAVTGTPPNLTIKRDLSAGRQYFQVRVTTKGLGSTGVRTWTHWKTALKLKSALEHKKDKEHRVPIDILGMEETTGSGTDSYQGVES